MSMKKLLALLLALVMVFSITACGGNTDTDKDDSTGDSTGDNGKVAEVVFPLETSKTFTIIMANDADWDEDLANNKLWNELQTKTNVKIEIKRIAKTEYGTALNNLLLSKEHWDGMFTSFLTNDEYSTLAAQDKFLDVKDIITNEKICPNFVSRSMAGREDTVLKGLTTPDGGVYGLAGGDMNPGTYLESPIQLYKPWVEAAGKKIEDIKTIEDLEFLLDYWAKNDMNGNGDKTDEIPYLIYANNSQRHMEAFLGLYGIATKDGTYENYVTVENGEVKFAPMQDAWKAAVKKLADWYDKGYIWEDAFAGSDVNTYFWDTILASPIPLVGMMTSANCGNTTHEENYVAIPPVKVEGYEPSWYVHPGMMNPKASIAISTECEDPEILLAWFDQFLALDTSVRYLYGEQGDQWDYADDGKIEILTLTQDELAKLQEETPSLKWITQGGVTLPTCFNAEDYESKIVVATAGQKKIDNYYLYESYLTDESWPRPYMSADQNDEIKVVRTDIMNLVKLKRAEWVTGKADIDAQYDQFVKDLETMGVDRLVKAMQAAYDNYIGK